MLVIEGTIIGSDSAPSSWAHLYHHSLPVGNSGRRCGDSVSQASWVFFWGYSLVCPLHPSVIPDIVVLPLISFFSFSLSVWLPKGWKWKTKAINVYTIVGKFEKHLQRDASVLLGNVSFFPPPLYDKKYTFSYKPLSWSGQISRKVVVTLCIE